MNKKIESLDVTQINIVDKNGRVRGTLGLRETAADNPEPCLILNDSNYRERLVCGLNEDSPFVRITNPDGSTSIGIGAMHDDIKGIQINTDTGHPAIYIIVHSDGSRQIDMCGSDGKRTSSMNQGSTGQSSTDNSPGATDEMT